MRDLYMKKHGLGIWKIPFSWVVQTLTGALITPV